MPAAAAPTPAPTARRRRPRVAGRGRRAAGTGAPAVAPAGRARLSVAFASTGRPTITLRWGEPRKVTGALVAADGRAAGERARRVTSRVRRAERVPLSLGHVTTDGAGRFAYLPTAGVSRTLTFAYRREPGAVTVARRAARSRSGSPAPARSTGRVSGAPSGSRKVVELQRCTGRSLADVRDDAAAVHRRDVRPSAAPVAGSGAGARGGRAGLAVRHRYVAFDPGKVSGRSGFPDSRKASGDGVEWRSMGRPQQPLEHRLLLTATFCLLGGRRGDGLLGVVGARPCCRGRATGRCTWSSTSATAASG